MNLFQKMSQALSLRDNKNAFLRHNRLQLIHLYTERTVLLKDLKI